MIIYFHHGVISCFVRVLLTLLFIFTEVAKYCHFQMIVTQVYVGRSEWWCDLTIRDVLERCSFIIISFYSSDKFLAVSNFAKCCSMSNFISFFLCLCALYRPQYSTNLLHIFFLSRYLWPAELGKISSKSVDGIRSKKIPENPQNPYLLSLWKFQKFISLPKTIRSDSYSQETLIGSISTFKKILTLKSQTSRS